MVYNSKRKVQGKKKKKQCLQCSRDKCVIPDMAPGTVAEIMAQSRKFNAANITIGDVEFWLAL